MIPIVAYKPFSIALFNGYRHYVNVVYQLTRKIECEYTNIDITK